MGFRWLRVLVAGLSLVVIIGGLSWFVVVLLPEWTVGHDVSALSPSERLATVGSVRAQWITWTSVITGLGVGAYGVYRFYLDKDKQRLDQDKHLTGLFDSATGRLESDDATVRAGGLRTLFRLMVDSPRDHTAVVDTVCDVLRHRAHSDGDGPLPRDVAAAADALRDRPDRPEARPLDLAGIRLPEARWRGIRLAGAELAGIRLERAELTGADLTGAILTDADLSGANLVGSSGAGAQLRNAVLAEADLSSADLREADLTRARLRGANLTRTVLTRANLADTDLGGTDLHDALGVTSSAVRGAIVDDKTVLPPGVDHPRLRASRG
ncbi:MULTISPECIES: pentapeptide repeat-containing protein [Amycolatopsis]|uniref:Pentapeptide repeat-containing protein n=1 Tax=Amycolatopsis albidoflavus TaxID=102226 RepID=A0ABW5I865_9PSEU